MHIKVQINDKLFHLQNTKKIERTNLLKHQ